MVVQFNKIKPKKFKGAAFMEEMISTAWKTAKDVEKDFRKTTKKWKKKPKWEVEVRPRNPAAAMGRRIVMTVVTYNIIYGYVDEGTKPHLITPKTKKALRWKPKGLARSATTGRFTSKAFVFAKYVNHPGFKGYGHSKRIAKRWKPIWYRRQTQAIARAAKRSGHKI